MYTKIMPGLLLTAEYAATKSEVEGWQELAFVAFLLVFGIVVFIGLAMTDGEFTILAVIIAFVLGTLAAYPFARHADTISTSYELKLGILTLHYPERDLQYVVQEGGIYTTYGAYRTGTRTRQFETGTKFQSVDGVSGYINVPYEVEWGISKEEARAIIDSADAAETQAETQAETESETESASEDWGWLDDD